MRINVPVLPPSGFRFRDLQMQLLQFALQRPGFNLGLLRPFAAAVLTRSLPADTRQLRLPRHARQRRRLQGEAPRRASTLARRQARAHGP